MREPPERREQEPRATTGAGFVVILLVAVLVVVVADSLFHLAYHDPARRTGWVGPLAAVSVFAYLLIAERSKWLRQLFADKL